MAKPEWGTKRICHGCGVRFYDLHRDPITCPKCGTEFDPEALLRSRKIRTSADSKVKPRKQEAPLPEDMEDEVIEDDDDDDSLIESTDDLDDNDDDIPEIESEKEDDS